VAGAELVEWWCRRNSDFVRHLNFLSSARSSIASTPPFIFVLPIVELMADSDVTGDFLMVPTARRILSQDPLLTEAHYQK